MSTAIAADFGSNTSSTMSSSAALRAASAAAGSNAVLPSMDDPEFLPPPSIDFPYRPPRLDDVLYQTTLPDLCVEAKAAAADADATLAAMIQAEDGKRKGRGGRLAKQGELRACRALPNDTTVRIVERARKVVTGRTLVAICATPRALCELRLAMHLSVSCTLAVSPTGDAHMIRTAAAVASPPYHPMLPPASPNPSEFRLQVSTPSASLDSCSHEQSCWRRGAGRCWFSRQRRSQWAWTCHWPRCATRSTGPANEGCSSADRGQHVVRLRTRA